MDLGFPKLDVAGAQAIPLGLDFQSLVAACAALQAGTPTAIAEARLSAGPPAPLRPVDALVALLSGEAGGAESIDILGGSFNPEAARNASANLP